MLLTVLALLSSTFVVAGVPADQQFVLDLPYRSQLNGTAYALSNCGPTSLSMALAYYGIDAGLWDVRVRAMKAQGSWINSEGGYSDHYGVFVHHLATVAEDYGLRTQGLWNREAGHNDSLHEWSADDLRRVLRQGHPVIAETAYRWLPGRGGANTTVDHYVVVHGLAGEQFVYSDPMDRQGGGPSLVIGEGELMRAMSHAKQPRAAFGLYRVAG